MKTTYATTPKQLKELYNQCALTFEGVPESEVGGIEAWIKRYTEITDEATAHIIKGETMNKVYYLTGDNAYKDNLTIIAITGINLREVAIPRFDVGGRWFDDIVDNNARKQKAITMHEKLRGKEATT